MCEKDDASRSGAVTPRLNREALESLVDAVNGLASSVDGLNDLVTSLLPPDPDRPSAKRTSSIWGDDADDFADLDDDPPAPKRKPGTKRQLPKAKPGRRPIPGHTS